MWITDGRQRYLNPSARIEFKPPGWGGCVLIPQHSVFRQVDHVQSFHWFFTVHKLPSRGSSLCIIWNFFQLFSDHIRNNFIVSAPTSSPPKFFAGHACNITMMFFSSFWSCFLKLRYLCSRALFFLFFSYGLQPASFSPALILWTCDGLLKLG